MRRLLTLATMLCLVTLRAPEQELSDPDPSKIYVFYLHGRIVEGSNPTPVDDVWGLYDYPAILEALGNRGAIVISEQRPRDADVAEYAAKVLRQIDGLAEAGVPESHIGVVGFSKGGAIATVVSAHTSNRHAAVRYVILASCADWLVEQPKLTMEGHVLSIFEASDETTRGCRPLAEHQRALRSLSEIVINTGAEHGAFYLPRNVWLEPTLQWIHAG